jgi:hypothetical protein
MRRRISEDRYADWQLYADGEDRILSIPGSDGQDRRQELWLNAEERRQLARRGGPFVLDLFASLSEPGSPLVTRLRPPGPGALGSPAPAEPDRPRSREDQVDAAVTVDKLTSRTALRSWSGLSGGKVLADLFRQPQVLVRHRSQFRRVKLNQDGWFLLRVTSDEDFEVYATRLDGLDRVRSPSVLVESGAGADDLLLELPPVRRAVPASELHAEFLAEGLRNGIDIERELEAAVAEMRLDRRQRTTLMPRQSAALGSTIPIVMLEESASGQVILPADGRARPDGRSITIEIDSGRAASADGDLGAQLLFRNRGGDRATGSVLRSEFQLQLPEGLS